MDVCKVEKEKIDENWWKNKQEELSEVVRKRMDRMEENKDLQVSVSVAR